MTLIHGGDIFTLAQKLECNEQEIIDFSVNINPLGLTPSVRQALIENVDLAIQYPDPLCRKLTEAIAKHYDLEASSILCGNGAADLIFRLAYVCKPKRALVLAPTFAEYALALKQVGTKVEQYLLKEENNFNVEEDFLEYLTQDLDMVWLCNPNNPTGQLIPKSFLLKVLERCEALDIKLIVDECFMDFVEVPSGYSLLQELGNYKCLVILKAFTKFYAMAGLRLGYGCFGDTGLKQAVQEAAQPWSVSGLAQLAGVVALEDLAYAKATQVLIRNEYLYIEENLTRLGFLCYPSEADYVLFKSPIAQLKEKLMEKGILIRHCANYEGLSETHYRIGIKDHAKNQVLIQALGELSTR
ncbi:MAG: threonine-phosphate decarboxylase CobD [Niameybacter sp.]|uniref:threonine-phosphate decarboxylase CobD n=1 Tax=Niameybacter sp. TaxID=2033640 RepID=UPI002FC792A3